MAWNNSNVVKEKAYLRDPGYAGTSTGAAGVVPAEDTATAAFVNERTAGNLRVSKKVTGSEGDKNQAFAFTVELSDSGINGKYGDMNFINGVAAIELRHGEWKTATGLPSGIRYEVKEESEGYEVHASGETGVIRAGKTVSADFVNAKGEVTVPKTGDRNHPMLWLEMVLAGIVGLVFTRKYRRSAKH